MRLLCFLLVLLAGIFQLVSAQGSNSITVPPNGFEVTAGQQTTIEWTNPSLRTVTIQLVPASGTGNIITLGSTLPNNGSATLLIPYDIPTTQQYTFKITDDSNSSNVHISAAFNISPPIPGSSPTSTSAAPSAVNSAAPTSAGSSSTSSSHSLSSGAIAGVSIGVALFLLLVVGIAFFFIRRHRQHQIWVRQQSQQQPPRQPPHQVPSQRGSAPPYSIDNPYYRMDATSAMEVVAPAKSTDRPWPSHSSNDGRTNREPSEVSGSKSWPREMEGMSRFQQREVVELPASPTNEAAGVERK